MSRLGPFLVVFAVVALTTGLCTPLVRHIAFRIGAVVKPDSERRVHTRPTPTLGGIAMMVGLLVGMLVAWRMGSFAEVFGGTTEPIGVVVAAMIIVVIGVIDDLREVSAPAKMAGTVLAASVLVFAGVAIFVFRIPFEGSFFLTSDWSYFLSVTWVIGMTTAINYIDGLDGLAAGIVAISAAAYFLYMMRLTDIGLLTAGNLGPLLAVIVLGMCLGFLPWNVHPAKIFMGDTGALLLGLSMASATIVVGGRQDQPTSGSTFFFYAPLFIPLLILGVPILDTAWSIVRRASRRQGVATADKDHLHHRLVRLGHGYWRSVVILWAWTALLSGFVLYAAYTGEGNGIAPFGIAGLLLVLFTMLHPSAMRARKDSGDTADGGDDERQLVGAGSGTGSGASAGSGPSRRSRRSRANRAVSPPPGRSRRSRASSRPRD